MTTKTFKIATWNVNSLRVRLPHVLTWMAEKQPDVLALQETKTLDPDFPLAAFQETGYHVVFSGQKTYNGVAIISRIPPTDPLTDIPGFEDPQRRILAATVGDIRILNLYIPNGESISSDKYQYKLGWLQQVDQLIKREIQQYSKMVILGDFNIAPHSIDVHDPKMWEGQVLFSEPERTAFQSMLASGFQDCFRKHCDEEKQYTWWDYRLNAFKRNLGLRIDHILASSALSERCMTCHIDKTPRTWERPSDHAPVISEFNL